MRYNVLKVKKYLFLLLCISAIVASDIRKINIEGLSSDNINSIYYGENGILWLATDQGLNKYDGVNNSVYRSNPFITTALNGNRIWHVEGYNTDTLLVVSDNAVHLFTPKTIPLSGLTLNLGQPLSIKMVVSFGLHRAIKACTT